MFIQIFILKFKENFIIPSFSQTFPTKLIGMMKSYKKKSRNPGEEKSRKSKTTKKKDTEYQSIKKKEIQFGESKANCIKNLGSGARKFTFFFNETFLTFHFLFYRFQGVFFFNEMLLTFHFSCFDLFC